MTATTTDLAARIREAITPGAWGPRLSSDLAVELLTEALEILERTACTGAPEAQPANCPDCDHPLADHDATIGCWAPGDTACTCTRTYLAA